mmetsp:Transcript_69972/g.138715  ORF Transcript_69972/g.138715 Transcript_69972/m.138715 type:complete len:214 (+) Transcript_69972:1194-1835(+)
MRVHEASVHLLRRRQFVHWAFERRRLHSAEPRLIVFRVTLRRLAASKAHATSGVGATGRHHGHQVWHEGLLLCRSLFPRLLDCNKFPCLLLCGGELLRLLLLCCRHGYWGRRRHGCRDGGGDSRRSAREIKSREIKAVDKGLHSTARLLCGSSALRLDHVTECKSLARLKRCVVWVGEWRGGRQRQSGERSARRVTLHVGLRSDHRRYWGEVP